MAKGYAFAPFRRYGDDYCRVGGEVVSVGGVGELGCSGTQYSLVSRETKWLGVRMVLKSVVALAWTVVFSVFYARIWSQKDHDLRWSDETI
ncbi:hypothetical protein Droror1_Dr00018382 [Drosera rotundifolia]